MDIVTRQPVGVRVAVLRKPTGCTSIASKGTGTAPSDALPPTPGRCRCSRLFVGRDMEFDIIPVAFELDECLEDITQLPHFLVVRRRPRGDFVVGDLGFDEQGFRSPCQAHKGRTQRGIGFALPRLSELELRALAGGGIGGLRDRGFHRLSKVEAKGGGAPGQCGHRQGGSNEGRVFHDSRVSSATRTTRLVP